jgi:hypothetical protein
MNRKDPTHSTTRRRLRGGESGAASRAGVLRAVREIPGVGGGGAEFQKFGFSGSGHSALDP